MTDKKAESKASRRGRPTKEMELAKKGLAPIVSPGRSSAFTPERQQNIVEAVRKGLTVSGAAEAEGLDRSTVNNWIRTGTREPDGPYGGFAEAIGVAEGEREQELVQQLESHFDKEWMAVDRALAINNPDWGSEPPAPTVEVHAHFTLDDDDAEYEWD
jgi:hypothetical protein